MIRKKVIKIVVEENPIDKQLRLVGLKNHAYRSLTKSESCPDFVSEKKFNNSLSDFFSKEHHHIKRNATEKSINIPSNLK